jgi:4-amino-4-deoxy-L-arabinose transferase-like glycosyltransferase
MPVLRRLAGATLLVTAYAPMHRLLDPGRTGPAGAATRAAAETAWALGLSGTLIVLAFAWVFTRMVPADREGPVGFRRAADRLATPSPTAIAAFAGTLAFALGAIVATAVHAAQPSTVDEMVQLLHAAAVASGRVTIPLEGPAAAWVVQNGVVTPSGWASVYPPVHTLLLAGGLTLGAPWLVGPAAIGVATAAVTRSAEELLGAAPGRVAGLLLALSPFWLLLGGTHSSHATAAAGLAVALWSALRARDGGVGWWLALGAALGVAVGARPWVALVCGAAIVGTVLGRSLIRPVSGAWARVAGIVAGGAPFALLLFGWNSLLFGHPLRLGYTAAFGPAHGLGLRIDPWGNRYGATEALAYTAADLLQLGVGLLESPLPLIALIGVALWLGPLPRGARPFAAWAAGGVAANAVYWHHGILFGPRMLFETAPAWIALVVAAVAPLFAERGASPTGGPEGPDGGAVPMAQARAPRLARLARWSVVITLVGGLALTPGAILARAGAPPRPPLPAPPAGPAVVFAHGSWASRIAARLTAAGVRRDSIETALRRNDVCAVDRWARWRAAAATGDDQGRRSDDRPALDFDARPGTPPHLESRALSPGNVVRVDPGVAHDATCLREARADRLGSLELELLAWRYPPLPGPGVVVARDLGPVTNLRTRRATAGSAWVLVDGGQEGGPLLLDYDEGMELLWGGAAGDPLTTADPGVALGEPPG